MNSFKVVQLFEDAVKEYTGAPYAIAVDSCTNALFLACKFYNVKEAIIPSETYLSVPMSIINAGGQVTFSKSMNNWKGIYLLSPHPIYDAAKRFTLGMYITGSMMCLSFHIKKHLPIGKGGMILTDNPYADEWLRLARYEGRSAKPYNEDDIKMIGWNMYMTPDQAARGLYLMQNLPKVNEDLTEGYKDLTENTIFHNCKVI
jgi:dTDP-4-amino-4,6-dideoxygalactose transaminase